jgi:hypothetical protein
VTHPVANGKQHTKGKDKPMHDPIWDHPDIYKAFFNSCKSDLIAALLQQPSNSAKLDLAIKAIKDKCPELLCCVSELKEIITRYATFRGYNPEMKAVAGRLAKDTIVSCAYGEHGMFRYHREGKRIGYVYRVPVYLSARIFDYLVMNHDLNLSRNEQYKTDWFFMSRVYYEASPILRRYQVIKELF